MSLRKKPWCIRNGYCFASIRHFKKGKNTIKARSLRKLTRAIHELQVRRARSRIRFSHTANVPNCSTDEPVERSLGSFCRRSSTA